LNLYNYGLFSFGHDSLDVFALSRIFAYGSLIIQELSHTADDSTFAKRALENFVRVNSIIEKRNTIRILLNIIMTGSRKNMH